jgi:hypothetical protein
MWHNVADRNNLLLILAMIMGSMIPGAFLCGYIYYKESNQDESPMVPVAPRAAPVEMSKPYSPEIREMIQEILRPQKPSLFFRWFHWLESIVPISTLIAGFLIGTFSLSCIFWRSKNPKPLRLSVFLAVMFVAMAIPMLSALLPALLNYPMGI